MQPCYKHYNELKWCYSAAIFEFEQIWQSSDLYNSYLIRFENIVVYHEVSKTSHKNKYFANENLNIFIYILT